jgi:Ni,Fe-hydrogenase III small subunit
MWRTIKLIARNGIRTESLPVLPAVSGTAVSETAVSETAIHNEIRAILGRALSIRAVDAGSCNGCELELHALNNPYYNIEGAGIRFVASPRHADLLLVTGPVSRNMAQALRRTYDAMPDPKLVIAAGQCACDGGIFGEGYATLGALRNVLPVDATIPGCPPPPLELLRGILAAVRR